MHNGHSQQGFQQSDLAGLSSQVLAGLSSQPYQQQNVDVAQAQSHSAYEAASQLHQEANLMSARLVKLRASKDELQREVFSLREQKTRLLADVAKLQDVEQDLISSVSALHRHKKALHTETPFLETRARASAALAVVQEQLLARTNELSAAAPGVLPPQLEEAIGRLAATPRLNAALGPPARPPPTSAFQRPQAWQSPAHGAFSPHSGPMASAAQQAQQRQQHLELSGHSHMTTRRSAAEPGPNAMSQANSWTPLSAGYSALQQAGGGSAPMPLQHMAYGSLQLGSPSPSLQHMLPSNMADPDMASLAALLQQHNLGGPEALQQLQQHLRKQQSPFQDEQQQQQQQGEQAAPRGWQPGQHVLEQGQTSQSQGLPPTMDMTDEQLAKLAALGPADLDSTLLKLQTV